MGPSRQIVDRYVDDWILDIEDRTPLARKIHGLLQSGRTVQAKALLPRELAHPEARGTGPAAVRTSPHDRESPSHTTPGHTAGT